MPSQSVHVAPGNRSGRQSGIRRVYLATSFLIGTAGLVAEPAWADDAEIQKLEAAIQRLEAQHQAEINQLRAEIGQLRAAQAETAKQVQAEAQAQAQAQVKAQVQAVPADTPKLVESAGHQFGMRSADGQNSIAILARLHFDAADYVRTAPEGGAKGMGPGGQGGPLEDGGNARRARLGVGGTIMGDWAYRLIYDFGNSSDSVTTGVSGASTSGVENAYITYNGLYKPGYKAPTAIDIGYMDVPWTLDEATSSNDIMFLERSSSQVVATEFGGGDFRSALGARSNGDRYWAAVYATGPQSGAPHTGANSGTYSALVRASYQIIQEVDGSLHFGLDAGHLFKARANTTTTSATNVTTVDSNAALQLSDRPELRVDPTVILNTGNIPANSGTVLSTEAAAAYKQVFLQSEYYRYIVPQRDGGINPSDGVANTGPQTLAFNGGYVEASYSIGGTRQYIKETGAYSGVIPVKPFSTRSNGFGALEIAARYSEIDLNDRFTPGLAPHLTGGVNGGDQKGLDFGINWYPNDNIRFMLDYIHTDVGKLYKPTTNGTVSKTPDGAAIDALALRSQFLF